MTLGRVGCFRFNGVPRAVVKDRRFSATAEFNASLRQNAFVRECILFGRSPAQTV